MIDQNLIITVRFRFFPCFCTRNWPTGREYLSPCAKIENWTGSRKSARAASCPPSAYSATRSLWSGASGKACEQQGKHAAGRYQKASKQLGRLKPHHTPDQHQRGNYLNHAPTACNECSVDRFQSLHPPTGGLRASFRHNERCGPSFFSAPSDRCRRGRLSATRELLGFRCR